MTTSPASNPKPRHTVANLFFLLVIGGAAFGGYTIWKNSRKPSVTYRESKIEKGKLETSVLATGTVLPENRLEIKAAISGRIERVLVKEGQTVKKGQILVWMSSTERAALLDAARSKGAEELARWEELYRSTPVVAPIRGTIISRNVEPGQTFTATEAILVMSDRLTVKAQVDETDISKIKLRAAAEIVLDAYQDQKIGATVDQIAFEAKTVNNVTTYLVDVLPNTTPEFMRAGMTANVTFFLPARSDVLLVPNDALKFEEGATHVLVKSPDGSTQERDVRLGQSDGKKTEVLSGLEAGDIVLSAQVNLRDGKSPQPGSPFSPLGNRPRGMGRKGH